jgi:general secretion pathway protein E
MPPTARADAAPGLSGAVAPEYLEEHRLAPLSWEAGRLVLGHAGRPDPQAVAELEALFGAAAELRELDDEELADAIERASGRAEPTAAGLIADLGGSAESAADGEGAHDLEQMANQAPVVRLVNLLLAEAVEAGASDVHLEAEGRSMSVRYRVDGVLQPAPSPPAHLRHAVVSRLKIMAEMDIAERRLPQDGRVRLRTGDRELDVRVSTLPTLHGESVVLRLLDVEGQRVGLDGMGMADDTLAALLRFAAKPHGVLLATGPTGSGKTTTLYGLLDRIRTGREKIVSVEDPVEYELPGVAQVPVHARVGLTFARALRSILRQDPDVLLVGEMRDPETAEICIQAALTGHLVLSTLHTNDAPGALTRLLDLGIAGYLVASTVEAVLAQRLVRRVCRQCVAREAPAAAVAREMADAGYPADSVPRAVGCPACRGTGFRGRTGLFELLTVDEAIRAEVPRQAGSDVLRAIAVQRGMRPLRDDGWRQVAAGITTPGEVLRVA